MPGASWQTMLWKVGPTFQLATDNNGGMDFLETINESILGGLSWAAKPYMQASEGHELHYIDVTSLFPSVMRYSLPVGNYRRRPDLEDSLEQVKQLIQDYRPDQSKGYLIMCDFRVPQKYHDEVDFPPVCKMPISNQMCE